MGRRLVANRKFCGEAYVVEEDGILVTQHGDIPYKQGDTIFSPMSGEAEVISEKLLNERYVDVELVNPESKKERKSYFETATLDEVAEAYKQAWVTNGYADGE